MEQAYIHLKVLLPFEVLTEVNDVKHMVVETTQGAYGLLPHRLDCTAAIVPGILTYESVSGGEVYLAVDEGVLVKAGTDVFVSVRNAIGGADLGKLHQAVAQQFLNLDERERDVRSTLARLESSFIRRFTELQKE